MKTETVRPRFDVVINGGAVAHVNVPMLATSLVIESNGAKVEFVPADLPSHVLNAALFKVMSDKVADAASGALAACIKAKHGETALSDDQKTAFKESNAAAITEQAQIMLDKAVRALTDGTATFKGQARDKPAVNPLEDLAKWLDDNRAATVRDYIPTIGTVKKSADRLPVIVAWLESDAAALAEMMEDRAEDIARAVALKAKIEARRNATLADTVAPQV